jgi:hypothetical protein
VGSDSLVLNDVADAALVPDGGIAVVNRGNREVLLFDSSGILRATFGREGEGPGEFRDPIEVTPGPADSISVWDWEIGRITVLDPQGALVRSIRVTPPPKNPTGQFDILSDTVFALGEHEFRVPAEAEFAPQFLHVLAFGGTGVFRDSLLRLPYGRRGFVNREARMSGTPLFDARGVYATHGSSVLWSDGKTPNIMATGGSGKSIPLWSWPATDRAVTPDTVRAYKEAVLSAYEGQMAGLMRERLDGVPVSERFPALRELLVGSDGSVWIQLYEPMPGSPQTWLRVPWGDLGACRVTLAQGFAAFAFDSHRVLGRATGEYDVESVEVYALDVDGPTR